MDRKVFGIGLSKTGTTSLASMLEKLGFSFVQDNMGDYEEITLDELICRMDEAVEKYNAFSDSPWCRFYQRYAERFPDSQFILTLRPVDRWMNSMSNFADKDIPIMGHAYGVRRFRGNEEHFKKLYQQHTIDAIQYFSGKPGRLLVLDIEADAASLARAIEAFLGLSPSDFLFPKANVSRRSHIKWLLRRRVPSVF
jgi:hypothetical protein